LPEGDVSMNHQIQAEEERTLATHVGTDAAEWDQLAQCGLSNEEIVALLWLRRWYQTGGSDRMELLRTHDKSGCYSRSPIYRGTWSGLAC